MKSFFKISQINCCFFVDRSKRGSSVTKEVKKILSKVIGEQNIPTINIEEASPVEEKRSFIKSGESSPSPKTLESKSTRRARPSPRASLHESSEERAQATPEKEPARARATRGGSIAKETSKTTRKTRAASVAESTSPTLDVTEDEPVEKKSGRTRATKATTTVQELSSAKDLTEVRIII